MTTFATESLQKLADLIIYINHYPIQYRKDLIVREISHLEELEEKTHRYPQVELRWLQYKLRNLNQGDSELSVEFGEIVANCEKHVSKNINITKSYNENELTNLIKKQKELIFNQCLSNATKDYLEEYIDNLNKPCSAAEIFKKAINKYQKFMYQESLYQFETNSLIYNQKDLNEQKPYYKENKFLEETVIEELNFINRALNNNNLTDFK
ncbi:MAG: hypothetical protein HYX60_03995, partial [Legionella longbeachae]|nr:hypothetical protein [Legionella longbeachae]